MTLAPLVLLAAALLPSQETTAPTIAAQTVRLDVRVQPLATLWFEVRCLSAEHARDPLLGTAVEAMRALEHELGAAVLFGWVEGYLESTDDAAALQVRFAELPEVQQTRGPAGPKKIPLRASAGAVATALAEVENAWLATRWPAAREVLEATAMELRATFEAERGRKALASLAEGFGLSAPGDGIPVLLVERIPEPGAVTHRRPGGGGSVFVGVHGFEGSLLQEVVLHEVLHALDVLGTPSLLSELRSALGRAGMRAGDPRQRDWVHTLFFLHAEDTVRSCLDTEHRAYGVERGYYVKVAEIVARAGPLWKAHRSGELTRTAFVSALVASASASD